MCRSQGLDIDGDGVDNTADDFPLNPAEDTDVDGDGIADFMDPDFLTSTEYNNNTIWINGTADSETVSETPAWVWGAVIAAVVMGVLAVVGFTRGDKGGKPEIEEEPEQEAEPESEVEEPPVEEEAVEPEPEEDD